MPTIWLVKYLLLISSNIYKPYIANCNNVNTNDDDNNKNININKDYYDLSDNDDNRDNYDTTSYDDFRQLFTSDYDISLFNDTGFFNVCLYSDIFDFDCIDHWLIMNLTLDTSTTAGLDPLLEIYPYNYWALLLLPFPVLTVFGNVLVVLSVVKERNLQTVTNYFIVSLAVADIMVAIFVMPQAVYVEVNNSAWMLGDMLCDVWVALDVMSCTASILNLTAISVDRYFAVTQPIKYARHKNSKRVYFMLGLTWVVSASISSPIVLGANYTERRLQTPYLCTFYNSNFLIYSSMGSFYIPCIVMVLLYGKIFNAIRVRARKAAAQKKIKSVVQVKATPSTRIQKNFQPASINHCHVCSGNLDEHEIETVGNSIRPCIVINNRNAVETYLADETRQGNDYGPFRPTTPPPTNILGTTLDHVITTSSRDLQHENNAVIIANKSSCDCSESTHSPLLDRRVETTSCIFLKIPNSSDRHESSDSMDSACGIAVQPTTASMNTDQACPCSTKRGLETLANEQTNHARRKTYDVSSETPTSHTFQFRFKKSKVKKSQKNEKKLQSAQRRERKATKTLAIVLGVFLFCWVPFFTINIMNATCMRSDLTSGVCQLDPILFSFFVWLGYMNSFINPVIYTIFNVEFRRAFKKLLKPIFKFNTT